MQLVSNQIEDESRLIMDDLPLCSKSGSSDYSSESDDDGENVVIASRSREPEFHERIEKHLVHDIDTSLDENNYDILPGQLHEGITVPWDKDGTIAWNTTKPHTTGRQNTANVIRTMSGVKPEYRDLTSTYSAWNVLFDAEMISTIVSSTNQRIAESIALVSEVRKSESKVTYLYETNEIEMKGFISLWHLRGLLNMNARWVPHK